MVVQLIWVVDCWHFFFVLNLQRFFFFSFIYIYKTYVASDRFDLAIYLLTRAFIFYYSPGYPRNSYTPSSSSLHYFTSSSPPPESHMWSTTSANSEEYERPKNGTLPDFQRLTNYYSGNGRAAHINYQSTPIVSVIFHIENSNFWEFRWNSHKINSLMDKHIKFLICLHFC